MNPDADSILINVKKNLGIDPAYNAFDTDVLTHINGALFTLNQLGVGPYSGLLVEDSSVKWSDLLGSDKTYLSAVKSYVYFKVRLAFDPPATSFAIDAIKKQIEELEWRLNVAVDPRRDHLITPILP